MQKQCDCIDARVLKVLSSFRVFYKLFAIAGGPSKPRCYLHKAGLADGSPLGFCCGVKSICSMPDGAPHWYTLKSSHSSCLSSLTTVSFSSTSGCAAGGGGGGGSASGATMTGDGGGRGGEVAEARRRLAGGVLGAARYRCGVPGGDTDGRAAPRNGAAGGGLSAGAGSALGGRLSGCRQSHRPASIQPLAMVISLFAQTLKTMSTYVCK